MVRLPLVALAAIVACLALATTADARRLFNWGGGYGGGSYASASASASASSYGGGWGGYPGGGWNNYYPSWGGGGWNNYYRPRWGLNNWGGGGCGYGWGCYGRK